MSEEKAIFNLDFVSQSVIHKSNARYSIKDSRLCRAKQRDCIYRALESALR